MNSEAGNEWNEKARKKWANSEWRWAIDRQAWIEWLEQELIINETINAATPINQTAVNSLIRIINLASLAD